MLTKSLADEISAKVVDESPWLTGPLLAFAGTTVPAGVIDIEPYLFGIKTYRANPLYTQSPQMQITQGLGKRFDFQLLVPYAFNEVAQYSFAGFQDITTMLGFQALQEPDSSVIPNLRLAVQETFPSGNFNHLDPNKQQADVTGQGVYQTAISAFFTKLFHLPAQHYLSADLSLIYTLPAVTAVNGFNSYTTDVSGVGQVKNGGSFFADLGFELTITKNWVLANDITYTYGLEETFNGYLTGEENSPTTIVNPTSQMICFAPAIEYNFNERIGIIVGTWFSAYVHNVNNFVSVVMALNYYSG